LLEKAYARADRQRPNALLLTTALQRGFNNVEVDVQPPTEAGSFPLGTNKPDPWGRTLEDYDLYPLQQWVNAQQGKIHPESQGPFTLMVDIRSSRLTENVYRSLERNLTPYKPMLSRVEEGKVVPGPIRVVVPNSAALVRHLADRSSSLFFVDVRAPWRAGEAAMPPSVFVAMASVRLSDVTGEQMDLTRVAGEVKRANDLGYAIRFYGYEHLGDSTEIRRIWAALEAADADFITSDDLDALVRALAR